jgi:nitrogen fixation NifU-like protein
MDLDSLYQDVILDHSKRKLNAGLREPFEAEVHHVNPTCGDEVTLRVHVEGDTVRDISYDALGCSISTASASVMTDLLIGRSVEDADVVLQEFLAMMRGKGRYEPDEEVLDDAVAFQGTARLSARVKCALLSWMAYQDALSRATDPADHHADSTEETA